MMGDLFAGIPVREYAVAVEWYGRFFGKGPTFLPNEVEAVWEVGEHQYVYVIESAERAGGAVNTIFLEELDPVIDGITARGIEPVKRETYDNGVRKVTYHDADGNEFGYGGGPA